MLGNTYDSQVCSIARALELVGERWSLLIIRDALFAGVTRFGDFQHNLGIASNVLASRLDAFVEHGIMRRDDSADYVLTDKGRALEVALIALTEWGDQWASPIEPPIVYRHAGHEHTGQEHSVHAAAMCEQCGPIAADDVAAALGPGMPADYLANRRGGTRAG